MMGKSARPITPAFAFAPVTGKGRKPISRASLTSKPCRAFWCMKRLCIGSIRSAFGGGVTALFDGNRLSDHAAQNTRLTLGEMVVEGSGGTLTLSGDGAVTRRVLGSLDVEPLVFDWQDRDFGGDCVQLTCQHLLEAISSEAPSPLDAKHYIENLRVVEAIYESHSHGKRIARVDFPPVDNSPH